MTNDLLEKINQFAEDLKSKRQVCGDEHKQVVWLNYTVSSKSNPLRDQVNGICKYCITPLKRPLNQEERDSIRRFQEYVTR
jgi:hypothetical protein